MLDSREAGGESPHFNRPTFDSDGKEFHSLGAKDNDKLSIAPRSPDQIGNSFTTRENPLHAAVKRDE